MVLTAHTHTQHYQFHKFRRFQNSIAAWVTAPVAIELRHVHKRPEMQCDGGRGGVTTSMCTAWGSTVSRWKYEQDGVM